MRISDLAKKGQRLRTVQYNCESKAKQAEIEQEIDMIKIRTMLLVREYKEIDRSSIDGQIKCAFVVFKSMEGCERLIQAYQNR